VASPELLPLGVLVAPLLEPLTADLAVVLGTSKLALATVAMLLGVLRVTIMMVENDGRGLREWWELC
jgi:hypothetical protein